ncbi:MAG: terpene cyclase/mutase family protein [Planctomycetes bacterium]|nr:terpene cyclase/mutase family protein [Planctomycetota bacterium]
MRKPVLLAALILAAATPTVRAQDADMQKYINRAIKKGVAAIRAHPRDINDMYRYQGQEVGLNALIAWTLLESDVPPTDELLAKLTQAMRDRALQQTHIYTISVLLMFFDRLGDPGDEPIIEYLALQLLRMQTSAGGWTYSGPGLDRKEKQRVLELVARAHEQREKGEIGPSKLKPSERKPRAVSPYMAQAVEEIESQPRLAVLPGDNSNTQFAMLALWVARRHGVPVEEALVRVVSRFQRSQQANGGWAYEYDPLNPKAATRPVTCTMSCAGMLGLALGHGITRKKDEKKPADLKKDPYVKEAMRLMDEIMKETRDEKDVKLLAKPGYFHYFLFSLERMAVVYNLKKIGDKDWYKWGAKILVDTQHPTGNWYGEHGLADTCFALLFLKRANVAEDLTFNLMGITKDPLIKKKGPGKKSEPDPFELPKLIPKDKKKTKGALRGGGRLELAGFDHRSSMEIRDLRVRAALHARSVHPRRP